MLDKTTRTVNAENCLKLAAFIESGSHPWNIREVPNCFYGQFRASGLKLDVEHRVTEFLGIADVNQMLRLTQPSGYHLQGDTRYSRDRAVKLLRNLAETGEVVW